jgi:hypothetical protein
MKNKEVHQQLSQPNVRDFLANLCKGHSFIGEVDYLEKQITKLQERLLVARNFESAHTIIVNNGWGIHDISDDISDYSSETYFSFIGTEEELEALNLLQK